MRAAMSLRARLLALTVLCATAAGFGAGKVASGATVRGLSAVFSVPGVQANGDIDHNNSTQCTVHYSINLTHHKLTGHGTGHVTNASGKAALFKNIPTLKLIQTVDGPYSTTFTTIHVSPNGDCTFKVKGEPANP